MALIAIDACETTERRPEWTGHVATPIDPSTIGVGANGSGFAWGFGQGNDATRALPPMNVMYAGFRYGRKNTLHNNFFAVFGDNGATNHLTLTFTPAQNIQVRRGNVNGTILATSVQVLPINEWHYIEVRATIDGTAGNVIVRVDGVEWINFTGNTRGGGTQLTVSAIRFSTASGSVSQTAGFDDLYVCDGVDGTTLGQSAPFNDFLGDHKVESRLIDGPGASSEWTPSVAGQPNWKMVSEAAPNTTDYVSSATVGKRDLYNFADLATTAGVVEAVQVLTYAQKSDAGAAAIKPLIRSNSSGAVEAGTAIPLSTAWGMSSGAVRTKDPDGNPWTISSVNNAQIGVEVA